MKRKAMADLGVSDAAITQILNHHNQALQNVKDEAEQAKAQAKKAQADLEALRNEAAAAKAPLEAEMQKLQALLDGERAAHQTTKETLEDSIAHEKAAHEKTLADIAAQQDAANIDALVSKVLLGAGFLDKALPNALRLYDRAVVKLDPDGAISNPDAVIDAFRADWDAFFGQTTMQGINPGTPPIAPPGTGPDYAAMLKAAQAAGNAADCVRIKLDAANAGVSLM